MKKMILVALFLHLVFITNWTVSYEFGDIIAFPGEKSCPCKVFPYEHYAIYVGDESFDGKPPNAKIFHRTGRNKMKADCIFGEIPKGNYLIKNYLDHEQGITVGDRETIRKRIEEKYKNCEEYNIRTDNCEHLATYVRYGKKRSEQPGTGVSWLAKRLCTKENRRKRNKITEILPDFETTSCDIICGKDAKKS